MDKNSTPPAITPELSFEEAARELELIVTQMESNQLPLQDALGAFKRGTALLQHCQKALTDVEQQIRILNESGELSSFQDRDE
jgi:exodeoxyribonuclease VII small subunit